MDVEAGDVEIIEGRVAEAPVAAGVIMRGEADGLTSIGQFSPASPRHPVVGGTHSRESSRGSTPGIPASSRLSRRTSMPGGGISPENISLQGSKSVLLERFEGEHTSSRDAGQSSGMRTSTSLPAGTRYMPTEHHARDPASAFHRSQSMVHDIIAPLSKSHAGQSASLLLQGAYKITYVYPGIILLGFLVVYFMTGVMDTIRDFVLHPLASAEGAEVAAVPAFFFFAITALITQIWAESLMLTVCTGMVLDLWLDGTWLHSFPGIPKQLRNIFYHFLTFLIPYSLLAFGTFWGIDVAVEAYQAGLLVCMLLVFILYILLYLYSTTRIVMAALQDSDNPRQNTVLMRLKKLFMIRTAQRYSWVAEVLLRLSLLSSDKSRSDICDGEVGAPDFAGNGASQSTFSQTDSNGAPKVWGTIRLRSTWTYQDINKELFGPETNESNSPLTGQASLLFEQASAHLTSQFPGGTEHASKIPEVSSCCGKFVYYPEAGRLFLFVWLTLVALAGAAVSTYSNMPRGLVIGIMSALTMLLVLGGFGSQYWMRSRLREQPTKNRKSARLSALLSPWMSIMCFAAEVAAVYLTPLCAAMAIPGSGGLAFLKGNMVPMLIAQSISLFAVMTDIDQVVLWVGPAAPRQINYAGLLRQAHLRNTLVCSRAVYAFFSGFMWVYASILLAVSLATVTTDAPLASSTAIWTLDNSTIEITQNVSTSLQMSLQSGTDPGHPVCHLDGGLEGMTTLDFMMLSQLSYEDISMSFDEMQSYLDSYFGIGVVQLLKSNYGHLKAASLLVFSVPSSDAYVISARGTHTWLEVLSDINVYKEAFLLQWGVRRYIPFADSWDYIYPDAILALASLFRNGGLFNPRSSIARPDVSLQQKAEEWGSSMGFSMQDNRQVVLTGHSLGGGAAMLAASRLGIQSVAFAAPNARLAYKRLEVSLDALDHCAVNVMPDRDYVSKIDLPSSRSQTLTCTAAGNPHVNSIGCHFSLQIACDLQRQCGHKGRPRIMDCDDLPTNLNERS